MVSAQEIINKRNNGILIDMDNIRTVLSSSFLSMDSNVWTAFVVHSRNPMTRNQVLKMIFDFIYPLDFVPLNFGTLGNGNDYMFLAKNCSEAIQKICANNLIIPNNEDPSSPLRCEIILQYAPLHELKISLHDKLRSMLYSLFDHSTKTLYLDNFCENEGLFDYLPLSQPKILYDVLNVASSLNLSVLKLRNNEIRTLSPQEVLWKCTFLTQLDLRNNKIEDLSSFGCLKNMKLTQIYLDGNPVCDKMDEYTYVSELKQIFPNLRKIDGVEVTKDGVPAFRKHYLCNSEGFALVNKFIEMYFTLYDKDRKALLDIYHPNALCSITNLYKTGQTTSNDARLRPYQINCRNLLAIADLSRSQQYLIQGNQFIIRKLIDLPRVEHDLFSFSTDLTYYTDTIAVINVCGVFREIPESPNESKRYLGFNRTFVLKGSNGEYLITNDMLHVYNALSSQVSEAFNVIPITNSQLPLPRNSKDKEKAIEAFEILTGLTNEWSTRFLERGNYNIIESMKTFMDMYKVDQIPPNAFTQ